MRGRETDVEIDTYRKRDDPLVHRIRLRRDLSRERQEGLPVNLV